jgi:polysaccharide export outer membrane protein
LVLAAFVVVSGPPLAARQQSGEPGLAREGSPADASEAIDADWTRWTSGRYRITPGDVIDFTFPFVPELNQTVTVQPDGYVTLKEIADIRVQGRTVAQVREDVLVAYREFVRDPVFTLTLKEFERPYFVANGEIQKPGRYELRGATTLTQALAIAGGTTRGANTSSVVIYRRFGEDGLEAKQINVGKMLAKKDLSEDPLLRPGDTIVVPKSVLGKVLPVLEIWRRY